METFDRSVSSSPGVFYYARFVDDILVIAADQRRREEIPVLVESQLDGMKGLLTLNDDKCSAVRRQKFGQRQSLSEDFEYLGYRFSTNNERAVSVDLAEAKVKRLKSRMAILCVRYSKTGNFGELLTGIRYLTANTALVRRGLVKRAMLTGIYYSYPAITPDTYGSGSLFQLDTFLRRLVLGTRTSFSRRPNWAMTVEQKRRLLRCSFVAGHRDRVFFRLSGTKATRLVQGFAHVR